MTANIFDIKHFAVHDGPGIRTTLFFKGCPLRCVWCHNPESISPQKQLAYLSYKCTGCRRCEKVCEQGVHVFENGHTLLCDHCIHCGKCEAVCPAGALTNYGQEITLDKAVEALMEDVDFYGDTGGVTLSGGECLVQADFCAELLKRLKENGINTAVDTCGFVKRGALEKVTPYTDLFLYDVKAFDEDVHIRCTGVSNRVILENLEYLNALGKKIEIRIPYVPDFNDGQIEKITRFLSTMQSIAAVKVLPYHDYAKNKYASLDMPINMPARVPSDEEIRKAKQILGDYGIKAL